MRNRVSNWNINNVTNLSDMFSNCESLQFLPDISIWNTSKANDISFIFYGCKLVNKLPDISKWNTSNITDKYKFFSKNMNRIIIKVPIDKNEINKTIYFLDNYYYDDNWDKKYTHDHLKELNENNTGLYINDNKMEKYEKYFIPEKEGEYKIELRFDINLTDCSYMFSGCENIKYIHFINFNTSNVNNMIYMFNGCK